MSSHGEQPRVEGTAMHGNKNNGATESSNRLRSCQQTVGDNMSSDVEQPQPEETKIFNDSSDVPGVIKTGESYFLRFLINQNCLNFNFLI